jgi:hypothetical protein
LVARFIVSDHFHRLSRRRRPIKRPLAPTIESLRLYKVEDQPFGGQADRLEGIIVIVCAFHAGIKSMEDCVSGPKEWSEIANEYRSNDAPSGSTVPG